MSRASPPSGQAGPSAGRHHNRQAGPRSGDGQGDAAQQKGKARKRRKRRRGRKVFARDDNRAATAAPSAPVASAAPRQPEMVVSSAPATSQAKPEQAAHRPPMQELPVFAALDLGTNNCRLLVAVPTRHGQFRVIDAFSRIVRLGEGLTANGRLGQPAMDRAIEALKICGDKLRNRKIRKARLIATEACRAADNGVEFLERVERETGLKLEIIDRRDRGAAGGIRLRLAGRARHAGRRAVRHRRRLVRNRADRSHRPPLAAAGQPYRRHGRRCRSASSRWPNALAAAS